MLMRHIMLMLLQGLLGLYYEIIKEIFIEDCTTYLPHVASPSMDEALAMRDGVTLAIRMGCNIVIAESNST
jgi:hypothetical protein